MKRKGIIIGSVLALMLSALFYYFYLGSTLPNGQQPLAYLNSTNVTSLRDAFNSSANSVRVILMLSPTCTICLQGPRMCCLGEVNTTSKVLRFQLSKTQSSAMRSASYLAA